MNKDFKKSVTFLNQKLIPILEELERGTSTQENDLILKEIEILNSNLKTNCESAAKTLLPLAAFICLYRRDLEKEMLRLAIEPLYQLGIEKSEDVIGWVEKFISTKENHFGITKEAEQWLLNDFPKKKELIEFIINELMALTYIHNLLHDAFDVKIYKRVSIYEENQGYKYFSNYEDLRTYLLEMYKRKLAEIVSIPVDPNTLDRDSNYIIKNELDSYRYRDNFRELGWILGEGP